MSGLSSVPAWEPARERGRWMAGRTAPRTTGSPRAHLTLYVQGSSRILGRSRPRAFAPRRTSLRRPTALTWRAFLC